MPNTFASSCTKICAYKYVRRRNKQLCFGWENICLCYARQTWLAVRHILKHTQHGRHTVKATLWKALVKQFSCTIWKEKLLAAGFNCSAKSRTILTEIWFVLIEGIAGWHEPVLSAQTIFKIQKHMENTHLLQRDYKVMIFFYDVIKGFIVGWILFSFFGFRVNVTLVTR